MAYAGALGEDELGRRLPWLLVFRAAVATALLAMAVAADIADWPLAEVNFSLYGLTTLTYISVFILGLLVRGSSIPVIVLVVSHLGVVVMGAAWAIQGTGGISSSFSFLYLLAILDGTILGGKRVAFAIASIVSVAFGSQLVLQQYGLVAMPIALGTAPTSYVSVFVAHLAAFFSVAWLSGYLAEQGMRARLGEESAKRSLQQAQLSHEALLESLPVGVVTVDGQGRVLGANPKAATILGKEVSALLGAPLSLKLPLPGEQPLLEEVVIGTITRYLMIQTAAPARSEGSIDEPKVVVIEDRTDSHRLEQAVRESERLASLGELAGGIAHEIRNPLAAISGSAELMQASAGEKVDARLMSIIVREVERLDRLVGDFVTYARPQAANLQRVDLRSVANEAAEAVRDLADRVGVELDLSESDATEATADHEMLRTMLVNLLRNAIEASQEGGQVELSLRREGGNLNVVIADVGEGIDPTIRPVMFEPFRSARRSSSGLGLSVVHRFVSAHGATIRFEDNEPQGTVVTVVFPAEP